MNEAVENLSKKIKSLSSEQVAEVEDFVDFLRFREKERALVAASSELSSAAFAAIWSNPEDDVYDAI